ncbi:hypothetical protein V6L77_03780 [Pannonibacter sp. Pt2-lr]
MAERPVLRMDWLMKASASRIRLSELLSGTGAEHEALPFPSTSNTAAISQVVTVVTSPVLDNCNSSPACPSAVRAQDNCVMT